MKNTIARSGIARVAAALVAFAALNGAAMGAYNFEKAWKQVDEAQAKNLPRTVTNIVEEIEREAIAASRWPDAARAFLVREEAMARFTDEQTADWLPAFAASVDAKPAPLQAVLQLHLAHTYQENSRRWRWGGSAPTKLDDAAAKDKMPPWSPEKIASTLEAQFDKVFAFSDELKAQKIADWKALFKPGTYPESYGATLYDFAVRDAIKFYGTTIPDKTLEKGLALYDALIAFHKADGSIDARAMAELERAEYVREFDEKPKKTCDAEFEAFLDGFIKEYDGKTEVVAIAVAKKAELLREADKLLAAHDLAADCAAKWPKTPGGNRCANIAANIESKDLSIEVERNWCAPWPEINVHAKNVGEVHFRLVPVTFDDLVDDRSMGAGLRGYNAFDAMKNNYLKRKPAKEWKEKFDLKPDYSTQTFSLVAPSDVKPGHYVLYASVNERFDVDKLPLFAQYITVTSLALVLEVGNGEFKGTVYRAESGEPVADARVELWGYGPNGGRLQSLRETYTTDETGRFAAKVPENEGNNAIVRHVRVIKDGEEVLSLGSDGSGSRHEEKPEYEHVDIFTDRSIYRPGQEIMVKGIAYHANPHTRDFHTWTDEFILLTLFDPNDKEVASKKMQTTKWGSFKHVFITPTDRLTGEYTVMARLVLKNAEIGESRRYVNVEEYKRPKFSAELGKASDTARLGEPVTVEGKATTYSGLPVQKAKVEWNVERRTRYPSWWRWFGGENDDDGENFVAKGTAETDENGAFKVTFTPVASPTADLSGDPSFNFTVTATVTDETGEARSAESSFEIGTVAWRASVWTSGQWHEAGMPLAVNVALESLSGSPVPVKGTLKVYRLKSPARPVRKSANTGYWSGRNEKKGQWDWKTWEQGEEVLSMDVDSSNQTIPQSPQSNNQTIKQSKQSNNPKWSGNLNLGIGAYRLVFETKDSNGKAVKNYDHVCVFDSKAKSLGLAMPEFFCAEKGMVKVGETLRAYWGTGYESGVVRVKVTNNGKVILDELIRGNGNWKSGIGKRETGIGNRELGIGKSNNQTIKQSNNEKLSSPIWYYELPIKDEHRGEIRIETTFLRENRLYTNGTTVNVPWDNKYLEITAEHLTSKLNPGKEETWKFKVSGPSEVLAFMYDRSLDAYKWHDVSLGFSSHFTPWTRYLVSGCVQNMMTDVSRVAGGFSDGSRMETSYYWPSWRSLRGSYGARYEKSKRGFFGLESRASGAVAALSADEVVNVECAAPMVMCEADMGSVDRSPPCRTAREKVKDVAPRTNLKETAFFFPDLEADADGNVSFTFTAPDALTGWKLLMVAHDNELKGGIFRNDEIVTTKPLMCEPNAPRFAREGDDFLFAVKVTNTEDLPQSGTIELALDELKVESSKLKVASPADSRMSHVDANVGCRLSSVDSQQPTCDSRDDRRLATCDRKPFALAPHESRVFEFKLSIPDGCGYLKYVAKAKGEKFADGEEGVLPVLSRRILVREAVQLNARGKETKSFRLDNLLASKGSGTIRHHDLTVRAVSRPAWYAVLSLPYLMEFPHECCEQTFSRYYANALGEFIANSNPRIRETFDAWKAAGAESLNSPLEADPHLKAIALEATPWVREAEHETAARARLGELFGRGRLKDEQERCLVKLQQARGGDGLWSWFPGGRSSNGISLYILAGFARLNHIAGTAYPDFFKSALDALDESISCNVKFRHEKERLPFRLNALDVRWLYLHSFRGVPPAKDKALVSLLVDHLGKEWQSLGLEAQALAAISLNRMGEEKLAKKIMASIKERGVVSDELGMYWKGADAFSSGVFDAPVSTQALIIEAFREVTCDEESADACSVWLLKQKQTQDWTTTAATADAIYALLLGGGARGDRALPPGDALAEVTLGGKKVVPEKSEKGTGMWSVRYAADSIKPEMGEIAFTGAVEKGVSWGGVQWSYFEDVQKVRAHEPKELRVEKKYYKKVHGPDGARLTAIEGVLEPGDEIVARLEITSDRTYEFVHLSDERPACAEPVDVLSSYRYLWFDQYGYLGYYQSTKDVATHYYIDSLGKGTFVIETSYRVQQRGVFTGGLATIQCMYAPEFTAHSSAETVGVGVEVRR